MTCERGTLLVYTALQQNFRRGEGSHMFTISGHTFCTPYLRTPLLHQILADFKIYFTF